VTRLSNSSQGDWTANHERHWRIAAWRAQSNYLCRVLGINSVPADAVEGSVVRQSDAIRNEHSEPAIAVIGDIMHQLCHQFNSVHHETTDVKAVDSVVTYFIILSRKLYTLPAWEAFQVLN